MNKYVLTRFK